MIFTLQITSVSAEDFLGVQFYPRDFLGGGGGVNICLQFDHVCNLKYRKIGLCISQASPIYVAKISWQSFFFFGLRLAFIFWKEQHFFCSSYLDPSNK